MIVRKNISDQVFDYFVEEIRSGRLKPGDKLPPERQLCEDLGVSRVPIREAIRSLSRMGILVTRHGEGTTVNSSNPDVLSKAMNIYMMLDENLVLEFMEVRKIMEVEAARLASVNATEEEIASIEAIHNQRIAYMQQVHDQDMTFDGRIMYELDRQFHAAIAKATHNEVFLNFLDAIHTTLRVQQEQASNDGEQADVTNDRHAKVIDALKKHDADLAAEAMTKHLDQVTESIKENIE